MRWHTAAEDLPDEWEDITGSPDALLGLLRETPQGSAGPCPSTGHGVEWTGTAALDAVVGAEGAIGPARGTDGRYEAPLRGVTIDRPAGLDTLA
ncbi:MULTISPECIES: hypothetical protein [Actinoalloteichus]|uniref:hypothetical protein n=1 Tax=Actinoalloteichus TaxID=65496 RepID=UPI00095151F0|nr:MULTISPECIES: hypothetical protein [Actinoalloteichus]